ncbi:MAG: hypothetical protein JSU94_10965 [Phycisphaerales bacterium]|nr:MAG: hypothetical protein JSU94_10965 [Phycisphaerales bacterium]
MQGPPATDAAGINNHSSKAGRMGALCLFGAAAYAIGEQFDEFVERVEGSQASVMGLARLRRGLLGMRGLIIREGAILLLITFEGEKLPGMGANSLAAAGPNNAVARWKATWHQPCNGPSCDEVRGVVLGAGPSTSSGL